MAIRIKKETCNHCQAHFLYDSQCGGDWLPSGVLQWYCPECGEMRPLIGIGNFELSKNFKRRISIKVARQYNLPFKECEQIANRVHGFTGKDFAESFSTYLFQLLNIRLSSKDIEALI